MNISWLTLISLSLATPALAASPYSIEGDAERVVDFGDGSDGAFSDGPAQAGITIGATIDIDTDVKSTFEFTTFELTSGQTINITGSNPLVVRVTEGAQIDGMIVLDADPLSVESADDGGVANAGGTGGPGGGAGGSGGIAGTPTDPLSGITVGNSLGGESEPNFASCGVSPGQTSGGGGACNGGTGGTGAEGGAANQGGAGAVCSLTRAEIAARFDESFMGGAGGAGGGACADTVGSEGAGGGGGGGALKLSARLGIAIGATGSITALGAPGGGADATGGDCGAAGGGGAGGSLWFQTGGTFEQLGSLDVSGGAAGADGICGNVGGAGTPGVIRVDAGSTTFVADLNQEITLLTEFLLDGGFFCGNARIANGVKPGDKVEYTSPVGNLVVLLGGLGLGWVVGRFRRSTQLQA